MKKKAFFASGAFFAAFFLFSLTSKLNMYRLTLLAWSFSILSGAVSGKRYTTRDPQKPVAIIKGSFFVTLLVVIPAVPFLVAVNPEGVRDVAVFLLSTLSVSSMGSFIGTVSKRRTVSVYISFLVLFALLVISNYGENFVFPLRNLFLFAIFPKSGGNMVLFTISCAFWFFLPPFASSYL